MKKFFLLFLISSLFFIVSCGDAGKIIDSVDTDAIDTDSIDTTAADTDPSDSTDTGSDDTVPSDNPDTTPDNPYTDEPDTEPVDNPDSDNSDTIPDGSEPVTDEDTDTTDPNSDGDTDSTEPTPDEDTDTEPTPDEDIPEKEIEFERILVDNNPYNPAFVTIDDLDNDGHLDMIVAQYGPASITNLSMKGRYDIYWGTGDLNNWTREELNIGGDIKYPHPVKVADLNNDGKKDLVVPGGFLACTSSCGVLFWLEGTGEKNKWIRHDVVSMGYDHFFFDVSLEDIDGDGITDILTNASKKTASIIGSGTQDEILMWFKGTDTADRFDNTKRIISSGNGGPFPRFVDINGDGKKDIAVAQFFNSDITKNGSFIWFEQGATAENWTKHIIDNESGSSFMLEIIDNLYGDGVRRAIGVNHVNTNDDKNGPKEGVFVFDIPADPAQKWPKTNIATDIKSRKSPTLGNQAAPGLFGYGDITGNGLIDLVVSGDGDSRVFWFEQKPAGTFTQHTLDGKAGASVNSSGSFGQAGGMKIVDLDGDGANEIIVTLYEDNKLYIYKVKK